MHAVIVANAARDHEMAVEWALAAGYPVLVEKPVALTRSASQRLADLAQSQNVPCSAAHVFLFAGYIERFSKFVADAGKVRSIEMRWFDPRVEERYGERKRYDSSLPVFADCLPHIVSVLVALGCCGPAACKSLQFFRGGAHVVLELQSGDIPVSIQLGRNADRRERVIEVAAENSMLQLDFSREPGVIQTGYGTEDADPDWLARPGPVARMLTAFLQQSAGGDRDGRLDVELGIRANALIDQASTFYRPAQKHWLLSKLGGGADIDEDLRYALTEILESAGAILPDVLESQIRRIAANFSGNDAAHWLRLLSSACDPLTILNPAALRSRGAISDAHLGPDNPLVHPN